MSEELPKGLFSHERLQILKITCQSNSRVLLKDLFGVNATTAYFEEIVDFFRGKVNLAKVRCYFLSFCF